MSKNGKKKFGKCISCLICFVLFFTQSAQAVNMISNASFESGNSDFSSDYTLAITGNGAGSLFTEGRYQVGSDPHPYRTDGEFDGVTAAQGTNFFMANGSNNTSHSVWKTENPISVSEADTAYRFEAYVGTLYGINSATNAYSPELQFEVGDGATWVNLGATITFADGTAKGSWQLCYVDGKFNTAGNYYVRLKNNQGSAGGNDLSIDGLYFGLTSVAPSIETHPEGAVTAHATNGLAVVPNINTAKAQYTTTELTANQVGPTFDGGTLQAAATTTLNTVFNVTATNGTIDTNNFDLTCAGTINGAGKLTKTGTGTLTFSGNTVNLTSGLQISGGALALGAGSTLTSAATVTIDNGTSLSGIGTINGDVNVNGTIAPGNSPGTLTVAGSVTQGSGSTFTEEVDGTGTGNGAGNYDRLVLTGASSVFTADGTLEVLLRGISAPANNTFTPSVGETFTIVDAEGGVSGTFTTLTQPASGLAAGSQVDLIYNPSTIVLAVNPDDYGTYLASSALGNGLSAAIAFEHVRSQTNANSLLGGLSGLSSSQLPHTFQQLSGDIFATLQVGARSASRLVRNGVLEKTLIREMPQAVTIEKKEASSVTALDTIWVDFGGEQLDVKGDSAAMSYDAQTWAIYGGIDRYKTDAICAGVGFGYADNAVSTDFGSYGVTEAYHAFVYGKSVWDNLYVMGMGGCSVHDQDTQRAVQLSSGSVQAHSDTVGYAVSVDLESGYMLSVYESDKTTISVVPSFGVGLEHLGRETFTETGDSRIVLHQDRYGSVSGYLRMGGKTEGAFTVKERPLKIGLGGYFIYEYGDDRNIAMKNSLLEKDFEVRAPDQGDYAFEVSASLAYSLAENIDIECSTAIDINDDQFRKQVRGGVTFRW